MTQQRTNDDIRADLAALLDELFPLDRDDEPNDADLSQGAGWWARTCIWWAKNCRSAWADRDALLARVSELETENARLRGQQRDDLDDYAVDELPKALRQLSAAEQRAERAEALAVEKCQRVAAAVRAARAAGPAGLSPQEGRDDG